MTFHNPKLPPPRPIPPVILEWMDGEAAAGRLEPWQRAVLERQHQSGRLPAPDQIQYRLSQRIPPSQGQISPGSPVVPTTSFRCRPCLWDRIWASIQRVRRLVWRLLSR